MPLTMNYLKDAHARREVYHPLKILLTGEAVVRRIDTNGLEDLGTLLQAVSANFPQYS